MKIDRDIERAITGGGSPGVAAPLPPGLHYVSDQVPGYTRRLIRGHFAYFDLDGKRIKNASETSRINALAIPPAYTDVWICADPGGHLQATGRDARGRKQYRYHPRWRELRDATKYDRMLAFGAALPRIRARVTRDLAKPGIAREKVLATVVRLLDTTLIRVGNVEYSRENRSYGLTTLRKRHLEVRAGRIRFRFRGKSGLEHDVIVSDPRVLRVVRRCMDLPGQELFQYLAEDGTRHAVSSSDINDYLREASGSDFTAKDYRTWAGSVFALARLAVLEWESVTQARHHIVETIKAVSTLLRNTPAVCRKCYVHPSILTAFEMQQIGRVVCASGAALRSENRKGIAADGKAQKGPLSSAARKVRIARSSRALVDAVSGGRRIELAGKAFKRGLRVPEVQFLTFLEQVGRA